MKEWYNKEYFDKYNKDMHYPLKIYKVINKVKEHNPRTVLDVGCGIGIIVKKLRERGIDATGLDFSPDAGKDIPEHFVLADAKNIPYPDNSFDVVLSTDFFEHLKEDEIDQVYSEMKRVGGKIIAIISFKREKGSINRHLTVRPIDWWEKKVPEIEIIKKLKI